MYTEDGAVAVDDDLRVEEGVALGHALRDPKIDGYPGSAAGVLDGRHVGVIGLDDDGF